jgi:hypothetical protein
MNGYGYQWRLSPACCQAQAVESGDFAPECPTTCWFWFVVLGAAAAALLVPVRKGGR